MENKGKAKLRMPQVAMMGGREQNLAGIKDR